jgi:hypothetical protein
VGFTSVPSQGFFLEITETASPFGHALGGEHRLKGAVCPTYFLQRTCVGGGWDRQKCGKDAPFLASIADDAGDGRRFHQNSFLQVVFHSCPDCRVVNAYHECD